MPYFVKKCAQCGTENHPDDVLCCHCGVMLPTRKTASEVAPPPPQRDEPVRTRVRSFAKWLIPGLVAIVGATAIGYFGMSYIAHKHALARQAEIDGLRAIDAEWLGSVKIADATSRVALAGPVQRLEDIRAKMDAHPVTGCAVETKRKIVNAMRVTIDGYLAFMRHDEMVGEKIGLARSLFIDAGEDLRKCERTEGLPKM